MTTILSDKTIQSIDEWLKKYPVEQKKSAVMAALMFAQNDNDGHLTDVQLRAVGAYLEMPFAAVKEVASFYSMYEHAPVGRYKIKVCTNISCTLCGASDMVSHLEKRLKIKMGENTPDGQFTLRSVECLGACDGAPMMQINELNHENLTTDKIDQILLDLESSS